MLGTHEVARLFPHVDERRLFLGLGIASAPTGATFGKLKRGQPIQTTTCNRIDDRLAGPGGVPDGLWPPGTAYWLATGQITRPGQRPGDAAAPQVVEEAELKALFILGGRIITALPDATPEQVARARHGLEAAWAALDERQGR